MISRTVLSYFDEQDDSTTVIALYTEGLDEPRKLLEAAKSLRGKKPIIAYKAGKSEKDDGASYLRYYLVERVPLYQSCTGLRMNGLSHKVLKPPSLLLQNVEASTR